ncbi:MAG: hypothetical protein E7647_07110 [Ruminococcaceae bacterium]|nr:hypothetical protein [Oscillospiraceae bacterium]
MVLDKKETSVAYRCPQCGSWVGSIVGIFSLSADMLRLKCPCKKSEMTMVHTNDKKVRLTVPCFLCPNPHNFVVSSSAFFDKELLALPCAYSGIDIAFLGKSEAVLKAEEESDAELGRLIEEAGGHNPFGRKKEEEESVFSDPQILEIVNFVIRDLDEAGEISCRCPEYEGSYTVEVTGEGVCVTCENCGAKKIVPVTSTISAQAFLDCDHLELE